MTSTVLTFCIAVNYHRRSDDMPDADLHHRLKSLAADSGQDPEQDLPDE